MKINFFLFSENSALLFRSVYSPASFTPGLYRHLLVWSAPAFRLHVWFDVDEIILKHHAGVTVIFF